MGAPSVIVPIWDADLSESEIRFRGKPVLAVLSSQARFVGPRLRFRLLRELRMTGSREASD